MSSSVLRCPGCGAADTSIAAPGGVHTCVYCGVRYRLSHGAPQALKAGAPATPTSGLRLVVGGLVVLIAVATVVVLVARPSPPPGPSKAPNLDRVVAERRAGRASARPDASKVEPAHNPSVSLEVPAAEKPAPATAEFTLETVQTASTSALWIYGYLHNTSPFALGKTKVMAVFYDEDGAELGVSSGYTEDNVIAADARAPTSILVSDAPAKYDRIAFEVQAKRPSYLPEEVEGLEIEATPPRRHTFLGWKYSGKVHNKSGQAAKFVKVRVLAFDGDDKLAGKAFTYASTDALADGATARFDGTLLGTKTDFKRFEFLVSGQPAR